MGPGSRTATDGTSLRSVPTEASPSSATATVAGARGLTSPCRPGTRQSRCSWGTPVPSTAPRAPQWTPLTPS
ncbi:hypothetical protein [Ornithinimicrobium kibberense]|uniref:hypothetical protein n=1 Tax=Ornithinimicrobium kibberense TaxID=282060 RepID=UPI00361AD3CD